MAELNEAVESGELRRVINGTDIAGIHPSLKLLSAAARRFLALTETGQRVNWCETHEETTKSDAFCAQGAVYRRKFDCSIVPKLLVDPLTEEET